MKVNKQKPSNHPVIEINGQTFINYYGLKKIGLSDEFLTRCFNHLISLASRQEIVTSIFVNGPLTVHFSYYKFRKLNLIQKMDFLSVAGEVMASIIAFLEEVVTSKKQFDPWGNFTYFGFFSVSRSGLQAYKDLICLWPDMKSGYVEKTLLSNNMTLYLSKQDVIEPKPNIFLLTDQTALNTSVDERLLSEIFFKKIDVYRLLSKQIDDTGGIFDNLNPSRLTIDESIVFEKSVEKNKTEDDFVSITNAKIVTAYWLKLRSEKFTKFNNDNDIMKALSETFGEKQEFESSFISRRLEKGVLGNNLNIDLSFQNSPYSSSRSTQEAAEEKEMILIAALSEILCHEEPNTYESLKSLLKPIDEVYEDKSAPKLKTLDKRLTKGRGLIGRSRK